MWIGMRIIVATLAMFLLACDPTPEAVSDVTPTWGDLVKAACDARCERRAECGSNEAGCEYGCAVSACADLPRSTIGASCADSYPDGWDGVDTEVQSQAALTCRKSMAEMLH
jgi:hypothetical protein